MTFWQDSNTRSEIIKRHERLLRANNDLAYRNVVLERCRRDPIVFINDWCWTFDPRNAARNLPTTVPFLMFPKQEEYIRWRRERLKNREFGIIVKSRDSGISYLNCMDHLHHWLFDDEYVGCLASRKEILVDRLGDPGSMFEKIRLTMSTLPSWMLPKSSSNGYMKLINYDRNNTITGEAGNNIGRGNRSALLEIDEAAFLENQESVMAAVSQTSDCVIRTSTPNGIGDLFSSDHLSGNFHSFRFHWKDDPRKNEWVHEESGLRGSGYDAPKGGVYPWYLEQKAKLSDLVIAQEIDIDFSASLEGVCIPAKWVQAAIGYLLPSIGAIKSAGLDIATEGKDLSVLCVVSGGNNVTLIESWKGQNTTYTANKSIEICNQNQVNLLNFDVVGVGAGVSGVLQTSPNLRFSYNPISGSSSPSGFYWQAEQRSSKEKFYNLRAELWYNARERFRKTWENREGIASHPESECISIPNHPKLISELSTPLMKFANNGKMLLESKDEMKKRGIKSPDFSDALIYALYKNTQDTLYRTTNVTWD